MTRKVYVLAWEKDYRKLAIQKKYQTEAKQSVTHLIFREVFPQ